MFARNVVLVVAVSVTISMLIAIGAIATLADAILQALVQ